MDYKNGKIYRIVCEETGRQYIGSTCSTLVKRLSNHKRKSNTCSSKDFINPKIILIEDYSCERKDQLLMRERYWMENTKCVNLNRPIISKEELKQTKKQYDLDHAEEKKQYRLDNIEEKKQYDTERYIRESDKIKQRSKQYRIDNAEAIKKYSKEKITCGCGSIVRRDGIAEHKRSKKHIKYLEQ